jgi:hypothetical protein
MTPQIQLQAQAVPTPIHYHHGWLVWVLFAAGDLLHAFLQIDSMARKANVSRKSVFLAVLAPLAYRTFFCACVFGLIWKDPTLLAQIAGIFGHPLGPDEAAVFALPMNNAIAGIWGLFLDSALGYVPFLKSQLPAVATVQTTTVTKTEAVVTKVTSEPAAPAPAPETPKV